MCGIVGYIGYRDAEPVIIDGLRKLEYRGYDSFGIATLSDKISVFKREGRVGTNFIDINLPGSIGIGHTRWATHGVPSDINSHPHCDCKNRIAVVHNGVIENYAKLKDELIRKGHIFISDTDTEVIPHLIEEFYEGDLLDAVKKAVPYLSGSFSLLILAEGENRQIAVRFQSPLVIGVGDGEILTASDITPLLEYTSQIIYLKDGDIADLTPNGYTIYSDGKIVNREQVTITWTPDTVKKGGFPHFMLKEIYEQPEVIYRAIHSLTAETLPKPLKNAKSITVVACGSSYNAGLILRYLLEPAINIPIRVEIGSEYKYMQTPVGDVIIGISQSGETADTLAAIRKGRCRGIPTIAITNVLGSTITREADYSIMMQAGPEISVAATKSFIGETGIMLLLTNLLCGGKYDEIFTSASHAVERILSIELDNAVSLLKDAEHIFYVGRGIFYPVMIEGSLKMKEISYIHAEAYAAGELKHGPFALLSPKTPVIATCLAGPSYDVMLTNLKEMKARKTPICLIGDEEDKELLEIADVFIPLPKENTYIQILTVTTILQMLAYYTAVKLGRDIDKPRNLAKSVTVE